MDFNLDFNLETSNERNEFLKQHNLTRLTKKELELCSNYILYGKDLDKDMTSSVDRGEVQIKTKFGTYDKKEPISLDAMLESPTFDESQLKLKPTIYKKVKPVIDKEKAKKIPGMVELWEQIQKLQDLLDENSGKKEKTENTRILTSKEQYYLKHQLIDLRRQQYYLMDSVRETTLIRRNLSTYHENIVNTQLNYPIYPRGVMRTENDEDFKNPRNDNFSVAAATNQEKEHRKQAGLPYFDFMEKEHIYQLVLHYWDIKMAIESLPDSPLWNLLWTLDFYIEKANLSEQQKLIVRDKKLRTLNKEIAHHLQEELGIYHQENYISTIWNKVVQQIADAAELNYDEWLAKDFEKAWKKCNTCQKILLRDARNFVRKAKASDGLCSKCKQCDRIARKKK